MAIRCPQVAPAVCTSNQLSHLPQNPFSISLYQETKYSLSLWTKTFQSPWYVLPFHHLLHLLKNVWFFLYDVFWILPYSILSVPLCPYDLMYELQQSSLKWSPQFQIPPTFQVILSITARLIFLKYHLHYVTHLSTKSGKNVPFFFKELHN